MRDERRLVSTNKGRGRAAVAGAEGSLYWVAILGCAGLLYCKSDYTWCYTASMLIQGFQLVSRLIHYTVHACYWATCLYWAFNWVLLPARLIHCPLWAYWATWPIGALWAYLPGRPSSTGEASKEAYSQGLQQAAPMANLITQADNW